MVLLVFCLLIPLLTPDFVGHRRFWFVLRFGRTFCLTSALERYESMSKIYYRQAKAALVCFGTLLCNSSLCGYDDRIQY